MKKRKFAENKRKPHGSQVSRLQGRIDPTFNRFIMKQSIANEINFVINDLAETSYSYNEARSGVKKI